MNILDRLSRLFKAPGLPDHDSRSHVVQVRCKRCGEIITARIDLLNDLSKDYATKTYTARKLISGSGENRCFQVIELEAKFDRNKKLIEQHATWGEIVTPEPVEDSA